MPPNFPNGLQSDPKDFNIVATRIHRVLQLRKQTEPFISQDDNDQFFIDLSDRAIQWLQQIHDDHEDLWVNPHINFIPATDTFLFIWEHKIEEAYNPVARLELSITSEINSYKILTFDHTNYPIVLASGFLSSPATASNAYQTWNDIISE